MTEPVGLPEEAGVPTEDPKAEGPPLPPQEGRVEREPPTIGVPRPSLPLPNWVVEALQPEISPLGPSPRRTAANKYLRNLQRRMGDNLTGADYVELITEAVNVLGAAGPVVAARRRPSPPQPRTVASPRPVPEQVEGRVPQPQRKERKMSTGDFVTGPDFIYGQRQPDETNKKYGDVIPLLKTHYYGKEWKQQADRYLQEGRDKLGPVLLYPRNVDDIATHLINHPNGLVLARPIDVLETFYPEARTFHSPYQKARYYQNLTSSRKEPDKLEFERFTRPTVIRLESLAMLLKRADGARKDQFARPMVYDYDGKTSGGPYFIPVDKKLNKMTQDQQARIRPLKDANSVITISEKGMLKGLPFLKATLLHEFTHVPDVASEPYLGEEPAFVTRTGRDVRSKFALQASRLSKQQQKETPGFSRRNPFLDVVDAYTGGMQQRGAYARAQRVLDQPKQHKPYEIKEAKETMERFMNYHGALIEGGAWFYGPTRREMTRVLGKVPKTIDDVNRYGDLLSSAINNVVFGKKISNEQRKVVSGFIDVLYKQTNRPEDLTATLREIRRAEPGRKGGTGLPLSKLTQTYLLSFADFFEQVKANPKLAEEFLMFVQAVDEEDPEKRRKLIMNKLADIMRRG